MSERRHILRSLIAADIAWHVGDTFIDWHDMSPEQQWKRIVGMIAVYADETEDA